MVPHEHLPHLAPFEKQPIVFLTVCAHGRRQVLADAAVHAVLRGVWQASGIRYGWFVGRYVIMPDHVHLFARATRDARALADWMRLWKSFSARAILEQSGNKGGIWQRDYFDRFLRSGELYSEKWSYVRENPVRAGLVACADDWPHAGVIEELKF